MVIPGAITPGVKFEKRGAMGFSGPQNSKMGKRP